MIQGAGNYVIKATTAQGNLQARGQYSLTLLLINPTPTPSPGANAPRIAPLEPGQPIQADLNDLQAGSRAGGQQDAISPFVGVRLPLYGHEGLFAEASFVHGTQYAGGLEIRFK